MRNLHGFEPIIGGLIVILQLPRGNIRHTNHGRTKRVSDSKEKALSKALFDSFFACFCLYLCGRIADAFFCARVYDTIFTPFCQWGSSNERSKEGKN